MILTFISNETLIERNFLPFLFKDIFYNVLYSKIKDYLTKKIILNNSVFSFE